MYKEHFMKIAYGYSNLNMIGRAAGRTGLVGAGVGSLIGAGTTAMHNRKKSETDKKSVVRSALKGGVIGGGIGAAGGLLADTFLRSSGKEQFFGKDKKGDVNIYARGVHRFSNPKIPKYLHGIEL